MPRNSDREAVLKWTEEEDLDPMEDIRRAIERVKSTMGFVGPRPNVHIKHINPIAPLPPASCRGAESEHD
jgi:chemotaxis protein histidine kinase CheA